MATITETRVQRGLGSAAWWLITLAWLMATPALAADPVTLKVRQAHANLPSINAYLAIEDQDGNPVTEVAAEQLTATVGAQTATVSSLQPFTDTGEGVAVIFLVDISKSLREAQFAPIRTALANWVEDMSEKDRGALITFGTQVRTVQDFTADKAALKEKITALKPTDMNTSLHEGLHQAIALGRRQDTDLPLRRIIVTLSDGLDDIAGGMTRDEVLAAMAVDPAPIYAIGFYSPPRTPKKEDGLKALGEFARRSDGVYQDGSTPPLADAYTALRQQIDQVFVAQLNCSTCQADGGQYRLQLNLQAGNRGLSDGLELRLLAEATAPPETPEPEESVTTPETPEPEEPVTPPPEPPPPVEETPIEPEDPPAPPAEEPEPTTPQHFGWIIAVGGVLLLGIVAVLIRLLKRKQPESEQPQDSPKSEPAMPSSAPTTEPPPRPVADSPPPPPPGLAIALTAVGDAPARVYPLNLVERAVIGRQPDCDLSIADDDMLSGVHCVLLRQGKEVLIEDLDSTNGTYVNGIPITGIYPLESGDRIMLGQTDLRITF